MPGDRAVDRRCGGVRSSLAQLDECQVVADRGRFVALLDQSIQAFVCRVVVPSREINSRSSKADARIALECLREAGESEARRFRLACGELQINQIAGNLWIAWILGQEGPELYF